MAVASRVSKDSLSKLPREALDLIAIGQYTLYEVEVENRPEISYALRTGAKRVFFLSANGAAIDEDLSSFKILGKVNIEDCPPPFAVKNIDLR